MSQPTPLSEYKLDEIDLARIDSAGDLDVCDECKQRPARWLVVLMDEERTQRGFFCEECVPDAHKTYWLLREGLVL